MTTRDKTEEQLLASVRQTRTQIQAGASDIPAEAAASRTKAPAKAPAKTSVKKAAPTKKKRAAKKASAKPASPTASKAPSPADRQDSQTRNPFRRRNRVWPD